MSSLSTGHCLSMIALGTVLYVVLIFLGLFMGKTTIDLYNHVFTIKHCMLSISFTIVSTIWFVLWLIEIFRGKI